MSASGSVLVVNRRSFQVLPHGAITIMRPTIWGNPFHVSSTCSRDEAIAKYRRWLRLEYAKKGVIYQQLHILARRYKNGETITLVCCCKPLPCHGDVIALAIRAIAQRL